jgi:hypothetical protein
MDNNIISQVNDFLTKSDGRFTTTIQRAVDDLKRYSGSFWSQDYIKKYSRKKRINLSLNNWAPMANAISSPISNSPWHIELVNKEEQFGQIQELIDNLESETDNKSAMIDAFRKAVLTGYGFLVVTTVEDEITGEPKVCIESASHIDAIAVDANCNNVDCSDAEEGAVINYISTRKAKRLYGEDVVPLNYPISTCFINFNNFTQWNLPQDSVAVISYYTKNERGTVDFYKIVGDKVVQQVELPIKFIPIIRLAGNEIFEDNQINYNGIIQQTLTLELGANIAYSTLIERCGRSPKANYMVNVDAIDGLERNMAAVNQDDTVAVLWKGEHEPVPLTESFETGDLQNTISTCRTLMEDTLGIPLTGIVDERERTATEILRQETSKESNTASYYNNAYKAMRTLGRIVIELLTGGMDLRFTLENGPSVITREMKIRQELSALGTIMPDNMKPIIAKYFADTLKNDLGKELSQNIVANLPPDVNFVTDIQDPAAIHQIKQLQSQFDEVMNEYELTKKENEQLRTQLTMSQINIMNNREQRELDWQKFTVSEQDKMLLEGAKLDAQAAKDGDNANLKQQEINLKAAESNIEQAQRETDAKIEGYNQALDDMGI